MKFKELRQKFNPDLTAASTENFFDNESLKAESTNLQKIFLYELNTISSEGDLKGNFLKLSPNRASLAFLNIDNYLEEEAIIASTPLQQILQEINDSDSTDNIKLKNTTVFNFILEARNVELVNDENKISKLGKDELDNMKLLYYLEQIDNESLYVITTEQITNENFDTIEKLLVTEIDFPEDIRCSYLQFSFSCTNLQDFLDKGNIETLKVINQDISNFKKIKGLTISSPQGTFLSAIKTFSPDFFRHDLIPSKETILWPKFIFPYQTNPTLEAMDWWNSEEIIGFKEMFEYLDSRSVKYNKNFDLGSFLNWGGDVDIETIIPEPLEFSFTVTKWANEKSDKAKNVDKTFTFARMASYTPGTTPGLPFGKESSQIYTEKVGSDYILSRYVNGSSPPQLSGGSLIIMEMSNLKIKTRTASGSTLAAAVIELLNFSYHAKTNFKGATKIDDAGNEVIDNKTIYEYYKKVEVTGDVTTAITNEFDTFILKNPSLLTDPEAIKYLRRAKWVISALSNNFVCNYAYNGSKNDDFRAALPFYLEIVNKPSGSTIANPYGSITVRLASSYGTFTENGFVPHKGTISKNPAIKLSKNIVTFPEPSNNVETTSLPSTNPIDVNFSNGEYSKFFVRKSTTSDWYAMNKYGNGAVEVTRPDEINCTGSFYFEDNKAYNISLISIGGIYINGNWEISLIDENDQEINFKIDIGNRENDKLGLFLLNI